MILETVLNFKEALLNTNHKLEMKIYKPTKALHFVIIIPALIPLFIGITCVIGLFSVNEIGVQFVLFIAVSLSTYLLMYLINNSTRKFCIDGDKLIFKNLFFKDKIYNIKEFKEIVMISYANYHPKSPHLGNSPEKMGHNIGLVVLSFVKYKAKNSTVDRQFMARDFKGKIIRIPTNFIHNSTQMVEEIKDIAKLEYLNIHILDYRDWKKGQLGARHDITYPKSIAFLNAISPYFKKKYLIYPPVLSWLAFVTILHLWFNWQHYQFNQLAVSDYTNDYFLVQTIVNPNPLDRKVKANILLKSNNTLIMENRQIHEEGFYDDGTKYQYSIYPFSNPYFYPITINVDEDKEPEFIYYGTQGIGIDDFNRQTNKFDYTINANFSNKYNRYMTELRGSKGDKWSTYIIDYYLGAFAVYLLILLILFGIITSLKKNV